MQLGFHVVCTKRVLAGLGPAKRHHKGKQTARKWLSRTLQMRSKTLQWLLYRKFEALLESGGEHQDTDASAFFFTSLGA